ncbi:MAG: starch-binding protein [Alistipes sp.]|nr:starch-binding protein [Alistipes sp.]
MKFLKYFSVLAAAVGIMSSCTSDLDIVQTLPDDQVVAPVLHDFATSDLVITAETLASKFVVEWDAAQFGEGIVPSYSVLISKASEEAEAEWKPIVVGVTDTKVELTYEQINLAANELGLPIEVATLTNVRVGATIGSSFKTYYSESKELTVTPINAEVKPSDKYDKVWVIGDYCGWNHGNSQYLLNYAGSGTVFSGVVDFGEKAAKGWKLTGEGKWDDSCNYGADGENPVTDPEPAELKLINGGGSGNITNYSMRFYGFEFDENAESLVLKKLWGANQIGIVGDFNGWGSDVVMEYNAVWSRFYADVEIAADGGLKFRADAAWTLNWGAADGGNIAVTAGNYRVYFNPVANMIEFNAEMYGQPEPDVNGGTTPEPPAPPVVEKEPNRWGVVGDMTGWGEQADLYMDEVDTDIYVRRSVALTTANAFKIRFNDEWNDAANYGLEAEGVVNPNEGFNVITSGGSKNIQISADGTYDIWFNKAESKVWVMTEGQAPEGVEVKAVKLYVDVTAPGWTNCNLWAWDNDANYTGGTWPGQALSTESVNGVEYYVWEAPQTVVGKTISVIFNNGTAQTADITGVVMNKDHFFVLNADLTYTMDGDAPVTPTETTYGLIGDFNGWGEPDVDLVARGDGWYVTTALEVGADGKFLIRLNDAWSNKFGFDQADTFVTVDAKNALTAEGQDMWIAAGTYDFYFNPEASELYVMTAGAADPTLSSDTKVVKLYAHKEGAAWAEMALYGWDGYDFGGWPGILLTEKETIDGKEFFVYEFPVSAYGITTNIIFNNNNNGEQTQDITGVVLNRDYYYIIPAEAKNGKFMAYEMGTEPVEPSFPVLTEHSWGVVGTFNGWAGDVAMEIVDGVATATIEFADTDNEKKFKVRADSAWANNFGYSATDEAPLAPVDGTEFAATFNGSDIVVEAAGKYEVALRIENEQGYLKITKL